MKLTIITVVRDNYKGFKRTLDSIRKFKNELSINFDYIVIDGVSVDGTKDLILENLDIINIWKSCNDGGIYQAMNHGAKLADSNSMLYWLNSGDILLHIPNFQDKKFLNSTVLYSPILFPNGKILSPDIRLPQNEKNIFPKTVFNHQGFMIAKSEFLKFGAYDTEAGLLADCLLMSTAISNSNWKIFSEPVAIYDMNGITTRNHLSYLKSYFIVIKKLKLNFWKVIYFQYLFLIKKLLKIFIPDFIINRLLKIRWG